MSEEVVKTSKKVSPVHAVGYTFLILALGASAYFNYLAYMTPSVKSSCGPLKKAHAQLQEDYKEAIEILKTKAAEGRIDFLEEAVRCEIPLQRATEILESFHDKSGPFLN